MFVNHVTTNPFFVPTQYGIEDASALLGTTFQWTGSETSDIPEMVDAFEAAIAGNADGIAVALVDLEAFNDPIDRALAAGIPVVSYNADAPNNRMAYVGQDLYGSGFAMGKRIVELVGEGHVALFIATPGQLNIQPRIDGAIDAIAESGAAIEVEDIATGAELEEELSTIEAYYLGHTDVAGMFAVDAGSTQGVGQVVQSQDARAGGAEGRRRVRPAADHGRAGVRPACSTSPSTSSRTCKGSCRWSTSTCRSCRAASSSRRRRTPGWCSSTPTRRSCSSTRRAASRATTRSRRSSSRC